MIDPSTGTALRMTDPSTGTASRMIDVQGNIQGADTPRGLLAAPVLYCVSGLLAAPETIYKQVSAVMRTRILRISVE